MHVYEIDPADDDALNSWCAVNRASRLAAWPEDTPFTFDEVRAMATDGFGANRTVLAVARDASGRVVGSSLLMLPTRDNVWTANVEIEVDPSHRRGGAGRALVAHAEAVARSEGRTTVSGGYEERIGAAAPGQEFSEQLGYEPALVELRRDLGLPVDTGRLDDLEAACHPFAAGYRIVAWQGKCPDELVEGRLELERDMSADAPHGDLDHEVQTWDEPRLRAAETTVEKMGHIAFSAGAVAERTGQLVAVTTIGVLREVPTIGRQFATVVSHADRGHRLGMLVKIANIRALMERTPVTSKVMTFNGETNSHMSSVNEELGYKVTARVVICQKHLEAHQ